MAGHSKWANIKRKKGAEDAKRGKLFTKLARDITVAARDGGGDIDANPSLRTAVDKAKSNNMPKDNIQRAIDRGTGNLEGAEMVEAQYEGYGPGGAAIYIKCYTDNKNRTVSEVRLALTRNNGSLADAGSVAYIFEKSLSEPTFKVPLEGREKEQFESLVEALEEIDDVVDIYHNADI